MLKKLKPVTLHPVSPVVVEDGRSPKMPVSPMPDVSAYLHTTPASNRPVRVFHEILAQFFGRMAKATGIKPTTLGIPRKLEVIQALFAAISCFAVVENPGYDGEAVALRLRPQELDLPESCKHSAAQTLGNADSHLYMPYAYKVVESEASPPLVEILQSESRCLFLDIDRLGPSDGATALSTTEPDARLASPISVIAVLEDLAFDAVVG